MSSVVVVDDVSPMRGTCDVQSIRNCGSVKLSIRKTQYSIIFVGRVRYVNRESQKSSGVTVVFV